MTPFEAWYESVRGVLMSTKPFCPECLRDLKPPYRSCLKCGWTR